MVLFDINDLSLLARLRSELMFVIGQLENEEDSCSREEIIKDLRSIVIDIFDFEKGVTEEFFSKEN